MSQCEFVEKRPMSDERPPNMADAAEMLWTVVANVSGGDWTKQSEDWQKAAARWRDYYFAAVTRRRIIRERKRHSLCERAGARLSAEDVFKTLEFGARIVDRMDYCWTLADALNAILDSKSGPPTQDMQTGTPGILNAQDTPQAAWKRAVEKCAERAEGTACGAGVGDCSVAAIDIRALADAYESLGEKI